MYLILFGMDIPVSPLGILAIIAVLITLGFFLRRVRDTKVARVTAREAADLVTQGRALLIDLRNADEVACGMAEPALWMPFENFKKSSPAYEEFQARTPREKLLIFYCAHGTRSERVASVLSKRGFKTANMGSFHSWLSAWLPVRKQGESRQAAQPS